MWYSVGFVLVVLVSFLFGKLLRLCSFENVMFCVILGLKWNLVFFYKCMFRLSVVVKE